MRVDILQHVPFEGPGLIPAWLQGRGHAVRLVRLDEGDAVPSAADCDWCIVMGGPMGVHEHARYPWLATEQALLQTLLAQQKRVLGICLGAQLLAAAAGGAVYPAREKEIGWFPVTGVAAPLPRLFDAFHWHGDTFDLPPGTVHLASTPACRHQAFRLGHRVLGLQFHLEMTALGIAALLEHCGTECVASRWIQSPAEIRLITEKQQQRQQQVLQAVLASIETG